VTDEELKKILEEEWAKRHPRIAMGERRIELAVAAMRCAAELAVADALSKVRAI
jgi:hypothetical protein